MNLTDLIKQLPKVGKKTAIALNQLGIFQIQHLLFHLPFRYQDKTKITPLTQVIVNTEVLIEVEIIKTENVFTSKKMFICHTSDNSGQLLTIRFFNIHYSQQQQLVRKAKIQCFAEVKLGKGGLEMLHPEYRVISIGQTPLFEKTLSPVYHTTQGIYQNRLRKLIDITLDLFKQEKLIDPISLVDKTKKLWSLEKSILFLHHPDKETDINVIENFQHPAQKTLILEEFCAHRLGLLQLKNKRKKTTSIAFKQSEKLNQKLLANLEFELTNAQKKVIGEISNDLSLDKPMMRLLQGDVGSGKTIVATFACMQIVAANYQVAIMAPTEILAQQHFYHFADILKPLAIKIAFLTGKQKTAEKKENLELVKSLQAQIIIGTHALFQDNVEFANLGLVIIDEQHRFGVHQRLKLTQKAKQTPHQLVMTATPIPRSLAMTAYADLDTSIIDELPKNRKPITTVVMSLDKKQQVIDRISTICDKKQQVYWVSTLIEESEVLQVENAQNTFIELSQSLTNYKIAVIHSRITKDDKTAIMTKFLNKEIDILVATTVIEVGVNVPNASLMIIENAERLGLAQLHQLRGRVGRDSTQSVCVLMYQTPLSFNAKIRLDILRKSNDGFLIAQKDLEIRGPGEVLGTQQTGLQQMKIADINRDTQLLEQTQQLSEDILTQPLINQQQLISRWLTIDNIALAGA